MKIEKKYPAGSVEAKLAEEIAVGYDNMTEAEKDLLPKVLFPDTHTDEIVVLGKVRKVRPVPLKISKQIDKLIGPFLEKHNDPKEEGLNMDVDSVTALVHTTEILCRYYGDDWKDIRDALNVQDPTESDIAEEELEAIAYAQAHINGVNDFFLNSLRILVRMLQGKAIASVMLMQRQLTSLSIMFPVAENSELDSTS